MNTQDRLQLIRKAASIVKAEKQSFTGLERQAVMLSDLEYTSQQKVVDSVSELDFNN